MVVVHPEVQSALTLGRPVIALETTIVTHGMPYPDNVQTALRLEEIIRSYDVIPATIGIIDGQVVVGLTLSQLEKLGKPLEQDKKFKVSRRDLAYVLSQVRQFIMTFHLIVCPFAHSLIILVYNCVLIKWTLYIISLENPSSLKN